MSTLVKWAPLSEIDVFERRMRRMLEDFGVTPAPLSAADMYETDKELVVELDVPGFEEKERARGLGSHVDDQGRAAGGEGGQAEEPLPPRAAREAFERRFTLPPEVDTELIDGRFHTGVLEVHVPKLEPLKARTIEITG